MEKIKCYLVRDLLPLYIDKACSEQTSTDIEEHLESCADCRKLYEEMNSNILTAFHAPEFDSKKTFRHARNSILGIILALAVIISCVVINSGGSWMGGRAGLANLIITVFYIVFWSIFTIKSRRYEPLIKFSFIISLLSFLSSFVGLIMTSLHIGGFISAILISIFSGSPFYGLYFFTTLGGWNDLYAIATIITLAWVILAWHYRAELKQMQPES